MPKNFKVWGQGHRVFRPQASSELHHQSSQGREGKGHAKHESDIINKKEQMRESGRNKAVISSW